MKQLITMSCLECSGHFPLDVKDLYRRARPRCALCGSILIEAGKLTDMTSLAPETDAKARPNRKKWIGGQGFSRRENEHRTFTENTRERHVAYRERTYTLPVEERRRRWIKARHEEHRLKKKFPEIDFNGANRSLRAQELIASGRKHDALWLLGVHPAQKAKK